MNGHVEKRTSKSTGRVTWRPVLFVDGRRLYLGSHELRREAVEALQDALEQGAGRKPADLTVRELVERWLRDGPARRPTTLAGYRKAAQDHVFEVEISPGQTLGDLRAAETTPAIWAAWQAGQLRNGRVGGGPCSPKSVRGYRAVVHGAFEWAVSLEILQTNPIARVKTPALPRRRMAVPDLATIGAYLDEVRGTRYWIPLMLASSALRRGEILGLRWSDVDLATGRARICRQIVQIGQNVQMQAPKTDAGYRELVLPAFVIDALRERRRERVAELFVAGQAWDEDEPVAGTIKPDRLTHGLRQLFLKRGLPPIHLHLLRHAVATDMMRRGTNPRAVQDFLGHANVSTTLATYTSTNDDDLAAASKAFAEAFEAAYAYRAQISERQMSAKSSKIVPIGAGRKRKGAAEGRNL